ncbi:MAG: hypothetical protein ACLVHV_04170 [Oscillospiraceae bacterium]
MIPVFPGTNCEYDSAGGDGRRRCDAEIFVIRNRTAAEIAHRVERFEQLEDAVRAAQMALCPRRLLRRRRAGRLR